MKTPISGSTLPDT